MPTLLREASHSGSGYPPKQPRASTKAAKKPSHQRQGWVAHIFLLPWMLGMVTVTAGPLIASAVLAFTDYDLLTSPEFIGFDNFTRMLGDDRDRKSTRLNSSHWE